MANFLDSFEKKNGKKNLLLTKHSVKKGRLEVRCRKGVELSNLVGYWVFGVCWKMRWSMSEWIKERVWRCC